MSKKKKTSQDKMVKRLKIVVIICILVLLIEGIYIGIKVYQTEKNSVYVDTISGALRTSDGYVVVGSSDFKRSKTQEFSPQYEKAKLATYSEDKKLVFESAYTKGYNSYFYDVSETDDGYVAVGAAAYNEEQLEEGATDGLLVVYDKNGNQKATKTLQILGDTTFTKVETLDDGYLVIGQSILENMGIGNDPNGGGIMIKYDFDLNEVWRANYGGSKSGIFNDFVIDGDSIYVVGKDATRYGVFIKYNQDGTREFVKNYEYTDTVGFSSIAKVDDNYVVVGGKTIDIEASDQDKKTEALVLIYDKDGNVLAEDTYEQNKSARFNKVLVDNEEIIAIGHTAKQDNEESTDEYNVFRYSGLFAKYTKDLEEIVKEKEEGSRDTYFSDIIKEDDNYLILGQTSSKELGGNNKDLVPLFLTYDNKGKKVTSETLFDTIVWD